MNTNAMLMAAALLASAPQVGGNRPRNSGPRRTYGNALPDIRVGAKVRKPKKAKKGRRP